MSKGTAILLAMAIALAAGGCSKAPGESLLILMKNDTGQHMNDFDLDTGSGHITYQIFSKNYTFKKEIAVTASSPLHLTCRLEDGRRVDRQLDWTVEPGQNSGKLTITFGPEDRDTFAFQPLKDATPKATAEENIADARKVFDAIAVDMPVEEAGKIMGHEPPTERKYRWAKDFGKSFKPECVQLMVCLLDGRVARAEISFPYQGPRKDQIVAEKGMSRQEFEGSR